MNNPQNIRAEKGEQAKPRRQWYFNCMLALLFAAQCSDAKLTPTSKTQACGQEILLALQAFSRDMGLPYSIALDDYEPIFQTGETEKSYFRDGMQHTAHFRLEKRGKQCTLQFFKLRRSEGGSTETRFNNYGSVVLDQCICE